MYRLLSGRAKKHLVAAVALVSLALVVLWLGSRGSPSQWARDFEECVEQVQAPSNDERGALMTGCNARFAGRRKEGGGYRPTRWTPISPCPFSTLPALSERVTRSSPAGLR